MKIFTAGLKLAAAHLNSTARVKRTTVQSIPSGVTTLVQWSTADQPASTFWSAGTPTIVSLPWWGFWKASFSGGFDANATGTRTFCIESTRGRLAEVTVKPSGGPDMVSLAGGEYLDAGEQIWVTVWQNSGTALNLNISELPPRMTVD